MTRFEDAMNLYQTIGIDVEAAIDRVRSMPLSLPCWQGDDVGGFETAGTVLGGGIQATGSYPGKARNFEELTGDLKVAMSHIPGQKRINLHAIYAVDAQGVSRDQLSIRHFEAWLAFAKEADVLLDFNPTFFASPMVRDNRTLSSGDPLVRNYWIRHAKASRAIAALIGERQGSPCLCNIWIPDGMKDTPSDRTTPRKQLKSSLDEIYAVRYPSDVLIDSVESKLFGIGVESYTVGSHEFYMQYAQQKGICCLLDTGHFHPTENIADKVSSLLLFQPYVALHISRPVRWDSDHVVGFDDALIDLAGEIAASPDASRFLIGLDYFDASINRIAAWVIGARNVQKALLMGCLRPHQRLGELQEQGRFSEHLALFQESKTMPFYAVWEEYCRQEGVQPDGSWLNQVMKYEQDVLRKRGA